MLPGNCWLGLALLKFGPILIVDLIVTEIKYQEKCFLLKLLLFHDLHSCDLWMWYDPLFPRLQHGTIQLVAMFWLTARCTIGSWYSPSFTPFSSSDRTGNLGGKMFHIFFSVSAHSFIHLLSVYFQKRCFQFKCQWFLHFLGNFLHFLIAFYD